MTRTLTRQDNEFRKLRSSAHVPDDGFTDSVALPASWNASVPLVLLGLLLLGSVFVVAGDDA